MITVSIDAMGGDHGVATTLGAVERFHALGYQTKYLLHGQETEIRDYLDKAPQLSEWVEIAHTDKVVPEGMKGSVALKQGKFTSMWNAIDAVRDGAADVAVSAGNTGALMALSMARLRRLKGLHRPALTALWPTPKGMTVVLDVGANLVADQKMLAQFARLGHVYACAMLNTKQPSIGLLNVGSEDQKGSEEIREVAAILQADPALNYTGFVEGDKISQGVCDVVVTNGFTGNAALKAGEGVARLVGLYVKAALTQNLMTKAGAVLASGGLKALKEKMDPANVNAGVMLGLRGLVVKSHGGADAKGFVTTLKVAHKVAENNLMTELTRIMDPSG